MKQTTNSFPDEKLRSKNRAFLIALFIMAGILYGLALVRMKGMF